jgi:4-alpha-glucanotransferase
LGCSDSDLKNKLTNSPAASQWKKIAIKDHHGVAIPLFSLHSENSSGIGEYLDLIPFIQWCQSVGFDNLQLLPMNDTGRQTSPYSAMTAFGLHPIYLTLSQLPYASEYADLLDLIKPLRQLNNEQRVPYKKVWEGKEQFLRAYFQRAYARIAKQEDYLQFIAQHKWLDGYSLFKTLSEQMNGASWESWQEEWKNPSPYTLKVLLEQNKETIDYHKFVQYLCFQQMQKVKLYASENNFLIQGDIPILIDRNSADVWFDRPLFDLAYSAGSAPDMYSREGQNWGFPIYAWPQHEKEDYYWWRSRLACAETFYHLYRLDHIVGFFRIWSIPTGHSGRDGRYILADPSLWIPSGEKVMRVLLDSTTMMPIGEDLGVVPPEVRTFLRSLGICGTRVMRWERYWDGDRSFIPIENYIPESMTTVSTHDSETLQLWWQNFPEEAKEYCKIRNLEYSTVLSPEQRKQILWDSHHSNSLFHINPLQEYLAIIPEMVWTNPEDERINIPGTISDNNWTYRFKPTIEQIAASKPLTDIIRNILTS